MQPIIAALSLLLLALLTTSTFALPICGTGKRINCVVDGDTIWLHGEKIRLQGIDAPELSQPRCHAEALLAEVATRRLSELLQEPPTLRRNGVDRYGRTLATVTVEGQDVGEVLIAEGLAAPWMGRKAEWCH